MWKCCFSINRLNIILWNIRFEKSTFFQVDGKMNSDNLVFANISFHKMYFDCWLKFKQFFLTNFVRCVCFYIFIYCTSWFKQGIIFYFVFICWAGLYYYPKDKSKTMKDLVCLATFEVNDIYLGLNWKKKYKAPSDYCFAIKHPRLQQPKSVKFIKFLCAEDKATLEKWMVAMRIAKVWSFKICNSLNV